MAYSDRAEFRQANHCQDIMDLIIRPPQRVIFVMKSCAIALSAFSLILLFWAIVLVLVVSGEIDQISQSASDANAGSHRSTFPFSLFPPAFGAAFGAGAAYYLGIRKQRAETRDRRHAALLRTYFALVSQWNILEGIRKHFLEKNRTHPQRFLRMPEYQVCPNAARVPLEDIAFIGIFHDANVLQAIQIAEQGFDTGILALEQWNRRVRDLHMSPLVDVKEFDFNTGASRIEVPLPMMYFIKKSADILYEIVDEAILNLRAQIDSVETLTKGLFPGMKALTFVPKEHSVDSGESPDAKRL